jgi:hypothetical protein
MQGIKQISLPFANMGLGARSNFVSSIVAWDCKQGR